MLRQEGGDDEKCRAQGIGEFWKREVLVEGAVEVINAESAADRHDQGDQDLSFDEIVRDHDASVGAGEGGFSG